jgi:hypothetical protein
MAKWCTIVPINPIYRDESNSITEPIDLENGVTLTKMPDWFKRFKDDEDLGYYHRNIIEKAEFVLISKYEANSLGDPDPTWHGDEPKSKQYTAGRKIQLANLALWLAQPSFIGFKLNIDAMLTESEWAHRQVAYRLTLTPHKNDEHNSLTQNEFSAAKILNLCLFNLPTKGSVWLSIRTLWKALQEVWWDERYLLLWISLESLFGPQQPIEISYRLSQRIAFFLAEGNRNDARDKFRKLKRAYVWRSKIVHGVGLHKLRSDESAQLLYDIETLLRECINKILCDDNLITKFNGPGREKYLNDLIYSS